MKIKCSNCEKWEHRGETSGICRANAPRPSVVEEATQREYNVIWPVTGQNDYCMNDYKQIEIENLSPIKGVANA